MRRCSPCCTLQAPEALRASSAPCLLASNPLREAPEAQSFAARCSRDAHYKAEWKTQNARCTFSGGLPLMHSVLGLLSSSSLFYRIGCRRRRIVANTAEIENAGLSRLLRNCFLAWTKYSALLWLVDRSCFTFGSGN